MTDKDYTHIKVVVDRSGSMFSCRHDMTGALDAYFEDQAKESGKCLVDYSQFDSEYESVFEDKEISKAKAVLNPRGATALNDAIGKATVSFGDKLAGMKEDERPATVIVVIVTDGGENASTEYTKESVKALVTEQQDKYNWQFVFLGANIDAFSVGGNFGFKAGSILQYNTDNVFAAASSLSGYTSTTRSSGSSSFTDEDRAKNV